MTRSHRAVFFDFGGTLFSYASVASSWAPLLASAAERLGVEAERSEIGRAFARASRKAYLTYAPRPYYLHKDLFVDGYRYFAEELGVTPPADFAEWMYARQRKQLIGKTKLRADCLATLKALRDRGLYLSIVSNIDDDHLAPMVEGSGLEEVLHHWTSSEEARSCKPDSGFFHLALQKAGCRAEEVVFVGDSREHDIQGARKVGMTSVLIVEAGNELPMLSSDPEHEPDHEINTLSELLDLV